MKFLKHVAIAIAIFAVGQTAAVAIVVRPFVIVPFGLHPDNLELSGTGMPPGWPLKVDTDPWGKGFGCGIGCAGFQGAALEPGDGLSLTNIKISDISNPDAVRVTKIVWTCGKDANGAGIPCSEPVPIWDDGPTGPVKYKPSDDTPVFLALLPEPASWALMLSGFGLVGTAMRRRTVRVAT
jgi:hypothetical protein